MTGFLLDTHAAVWWWVSSPDLGNRARAAIAERTSDVWVSAISAGEIAIKHRIGKFDDIGDPAEAYPRLMAKHGFRDLPIDHAHGLKVGLLARDHRDPFDRIIAAQALVEGLTVVTCDAKLTAFGCKVLW